MHETYQLHKGEFLLIILLFWIGRNAKHMLLSQKLPEAEENFCFYTMIIISAWH